MITPCPYSQPVIDWLASHDITMKLTGPYPTVPPWATDKDNCTPYTHGIFPRKNHIHGDGWTVAFERPGKAPLVISYWDSYRDAIRRHVLKDRGIHLERLRAYPEHSYTVALLDAAGLTLAQLRTMYDVDIRPTPYDALSACEYHHISSFPEWCADCGYSDDSISARDIWEKCSEQWIYISLFFTPEELVELEDLLS